MDETESLLPGAEYDEAWEADTPLSGADDGEHGEGRQDAPDTEAQSGEQAEEKAGAPDGQAPRAGTEEDRQAAPDNDESEELFRQKAENEALRRQLEALRAGGNAAAKPDQAASAAVNGAVNVAAMPPELAEEFQAFAARYPDLAPLAQENTVLGEGIRKRLEAYGAEEAADYAAPAWEARRTRQEAERQRAEEARRSSERYAQEFQATVFSGAPDFAAAMQAGRGPQYLAEVERWAKDKPYLEATRLLGVIEQGSAAETLQLLERFRTERKADRSAAVHAAAAAMAAVPGHQQPLGIKTQPRKADYDAAWDEKD